MNRYERIKILREFVAAGLAWKRAGRPKAGQEHEAFVEAESKFLLMLESVSIGDLLVEEKETWKKTVAASGLYQ